MYAKCAVCKNRLEERNSAFLQCPNHRNKPATWHCDICDKLSGSCKCKEQKNAGTIRGENNADKTV